MPTDVSLRRYVHGGTNHSAGNTNEASYIKALLANGGWWDLEYAMPVLSDGTERIPWSNTYRCTAVNGQGASWNQDGDASGWGLKLYSTNAASDGYTNDYNYSGAALVRYQNSGPGEAAATQNPTGFKVGAYFKCNAAGVGGMVQMYLFGQDINGVFNPGTQNHGYATTDGTNYVLTQAGTYGASSKATSQKTPASVTGKTYYSIRFLVDTTWRYHSMYVKFKDPAFDLITLSYRVGFRPSGTDGSTANWDANGSQGEYLLIDKLSLKPFNISANYSFQNTYGTDSDVKFSEIEADSGAAGSGAGGGS